MKPLSIDRIRTFGVAWIDFAVFAALLLAINLLGSPGDPGWMKVNPTPWLLLPLFMGARYGFAWGLGSGLLVSITVIVTQFLTTSLTAAEIMRPVFYYLGLPAVGFIAGEIRGALAGKLAEAEKHAEELSARRQSLEAELDVAEQARFELQEHLALQGVELASIDQQLRSLFAPGAGPVFPNLLRVLRDSSGLTDAGIYAVQGAEMRRIAWIGDSTQLPEALNVHTTEIASLAISRRALTTCREVWEQTPAQNSPFIAALPWQGSGGQVAALLLIHRMHFLSANWKTFARIQMVCRWVAQFVELRVAASKAPVLQGSDAMVVAPDLFARTLAAAEATHRDHRLPSCVAFFEFTRPVQPHVARLLPQAVATVMRGSDVATFNDEIEMPLLKVLLPMEGMRDAEALLDRAQRSILRVPQLRGLVSAQLAMTEDADTPAAAEAGMEALPESQSPDMSAAAA